MATRFYLPNGGAAAFDTLAFSVYWQAVLTPDHYHYAMPKAKSSVAHGYKNAYSTYSPYAILQFISGQLAAYNFTAADEIKLQELVWADTNNTIALGVSIRVISADGSTVRGTLYEGQSPSVNNGNRSLGGSGAHVHVQNSVAMQNGDRIVVELGGVQTAGETGYYHYLADDSATDLPENDTDTDTTKNSWVEFSATLADYVGGLAIVKIINE